MKRQLLKGNNVEYRTNDMAKILQHFALLWSHKALLLSMSPKFIDGQTYELQA